MILQEWTEWRESFGMSGLRPPKNGTAKTIGRERATLYKNHVSDFEKRTFRFARRM